MLSKKNAEVKITTLLGKGAELTGDFNVQGSARIDGTINGDVTIKGTLIMGAGGVINGNVSAEAIIIGGEVQGSILAPEKAELTATARVIGDISTKIIVIDENAIFQGRCDMNQEVVDRKSRANHSKAIRNGRKSAKAAIEEALKEVEEANRMDNDDNTSDSGAEAVAAAQTAENTQL